MAAPDVCAFAWATIKALLLCGVLSSLLYVATDAVAIWLYDGYGYTDQNYSELLATGAPTRPFMLWVSVAYNLRRRSDWASGHQLVGSALRV